MDLERLDIYLPRKEEREQFREEAEEFHGAVYPPEDWTNSDKFRAAVYFACNEAGEGTAPRDAVKGLYEDLDGGRAMRKILHDIDDVKTTEVEEEQHLKLTADGLRSCRELFSGDTGAD